MKQFDVYRNPGRNRALIPYVIVVQSSFYERYRRRVVVPLFAADELARSVRLPESPVNPVLEIEGVAVVFNPLEIVSLPCEVLTERVGDLSEHADSLIAALDELFSRAWR